MDIVPFINAVHRKLKELYPDREFEVGPMGNLRIKPEIDGDGNMILYHGTQRPIKDNKFRYMAYMSAIPEYAYRYALEPEEWNPPSDSIKDNIPRLYRVKIPVAEASKLERGGPDIDDAEDEKQAIFRVIEDALQWTTGDSLLPWEGYKKGERDKDLYNGLNHMLEEVDVNSLKDIDKRAAQLSHVDPSWDRLKIVLAKAGKYVQ